VQRGTLASVAEKRAIKESRNHPVCGPVRLLPTLPTVVRTYAAVGKTPVVQEKLSRDHLSVITALSQPGGQALHMMEQERSFNGEDVVRFLRHLLRQVPGKVLVVWDGSPIHRGQAVKDFLAGGASHRVQLEHLPGYAPDLNPEEGVWKHLKCVELKNLCCQSLSELKIELRKVKERLRHKRDVILGCIRQPGFVV
jgi:transposase